MICVAVGRAWVGGRGLACCGKRAFPAAKRFEPQHAVARRSTGVEYRGGSLRKAYGDLAGRTASYEPVERLVSLMAR